MKRLAAPLAALALASCGPTLYAEIEIPELRVTLPARQVPAFDSALPAYWCDPAGPASQACVLALQTTFDLSGQVPALEQSNVTSEVRLTEVALALVASSGGTLTDLRNVARVTIRTGASGSSPGVVLASYTRPAGGTPSTITVSGQSNVDLSPYLTSGQLTLAVEVAVEGGTPAFTADLTGAFYVRVKLDYGKYVGL